jgi:chaperonin GroES
MNIKPLNDRVIVQRDEEEKVSGGGIILPSDGEKPAVGTVLAVGPGVRNEAGAWKPTTVKPGDRIIFGKYAGFDCKIDGVEHLVMRETDVIGVLE